MTPAHRTREHSRGSEWSSAALAVLLAACGAGTVVAPSPTAPTASVSPASTASAVAASRPAPSMVPPPCFGPCPAGTHRSARFQPSLTYTIPDGWFTSDQPTEYVFQVSDQALDGIYLFRDPRAHSQAPDCPQTADLTIGTSAKELTDWIAALPGLTATPPKAVTVGGLPGYTLDVRVAPSWKHACPYSDGEPVVPLIVDGGPNYELDWNVGATGVRIWVLDAGAGGRIWIDVEAGDRLTFAEIVERAIPIIESLEFSTP
jgi:hypothetical protein